MSTKTNFNQQSISPLVIVLLLTLTLVQLVPVRAQFGSLFGQPSPWASSSSSTGFGFPPPPPPRRPFFDNFRPLNSLIGSYPTNNYAPPRPQSPARECRKTGACKNMDHGTTLATNWLMPTTTTTLPAPLFRPTTPVTTTPVPVPASVTTMRSITTTRQTTVKPPPRISRADGPTDYTLSSPANSSTTTVTSVSSTQTTTTTTPKPTSVVPSTTLATVITTTTTKAPFISLPPSSNTTVRPNLTTNSTATTTTMTTMTTTRLS